MTIDEEIKYWKRQAEETESDAWLIAFGVMVGLEIARRALEDKNV